MSIPSNKYLRYVILISRDNGNDNCKNYIKEIKDIQPESRIIRWNQE